MKLNNIVRIEYAKATEVAAAFSPLSESTCMVGELTWKELKIQAPAKMEVDDVVEDKELVKSVELTFRGCECQIPPYAVCLRLTLHDGTHVLLGDGMRPHLMVLQKEQHPDNLADSQLTGYRVLRKSKYKPLTIISP